MKSNNAAFAVMQQMLQERCIAEPTFAIKMANPSKSMEGAVNHLCRTIQKSGLCVVCPKGYSCGFSISAIFLSANLLGQP